VICIKRLLKAMLRCRVSAGLDMKKPLIPVEINGFQILVAGTGFEPVTFGL
jgi:hypothetical protein